MKNKYILILLLCAITCYASFAQNSNKQTEEIVKYKFNYSFEERTFYIYKVSFNTKIHRTYSEGVTRDFERNKDFFISLRNPTAIKDGFILLNTSIDSVKYEYNDGKQHIKWSSQSDDDKTPSNPDFDETFALLGRYFVSHISPYYEVALIDGNILEVGRENIKEMSDSTLAEIWYKSISDNNLKLYTDPNKNVLRNGRFAINDAWQMPFSISIEGITYTCDTAKVKFYLYDMKNFHIKAEMNEMKPNLNEKASAIGMERAMLQVDSTSLSKGYWDVSVSPFGILNKAEGEFNTKSTMYYKNTPFTDEITTKIQFNLERTVSWHD